MLKVIQVKIHEHTSYRKKISKFAWFDQLKDRLDRSKHVYAEFYFSLNFT